VLLVQNSGLLFYTIHFRCLLRHGRPSQLLLSSVLVSHADNNCWTKWPLTSDHASQDNHVTNWPAATILVRGIWQKCRSKKQYIFGKRDDDRWTGTRAATRWATRTTDFLPRRISIVWFVARTGRRTERASSDEGQEVVVGSTSCLDAAA